jgi:hypothetical protein
LEQQIYIHTGPPIKVVHVQIDPRDEVLSTRFQNTYYF